MKTQKLSVILAAICAGFMIATPKAFARNYQVRSAPVNLNVRSDETVSFAIGKQMYVKNLVIQAEGVGQDSTVEVMVNGNVKGTLYAPGRDPSYVVTIEEATASVEFRHRAGATMRISNITATLSETVQTPPAPQTPAERSALALSERTIDLIVELAPFCSLNEEATYLVPIKIAAGKLKSMVVAHGFYADSTRAAILDLQAKIEKADSFLLLKMESESMFDQIVEIYSIKETLKDLLN